MPTTGPLPAASLGASALGGGGGGGGGGGAPGSATALPLAVEDGGVADCLSAALALCSPCSSVSFVGSTLRPCAYAFAASLICPQKKSAAPKRE